MENQRNWVMKGVTLFQEQYSDQRKPEQSVTHIQEFHCLIQIHSGSHCFDAFLMDDRWNILPIAEWGLSGRQEPVRLVYSLIVGEFKLLLKEKY